MHLGLRSRMRSILNRLCRVRRLGINLTNKKRLKQKNVSIIASNCVGAVISKELGMRFNSPTVNLFMMAPDFLKFVSNLKYYIDMDLEQVDDALCNYPVGKLDDVIIHFLHYQTFEQAKEKWEERCKRVDYSNLYFIMSERDGCTYDIIKQFDALPYKNKVVFTAKEYPEIVCAVHIKNSELPSEEVGDLCAYMGKKGGKRVIDQYDYVSFLNG